MKTRLDVALFERGLAKSREEAKALVMAGQVYIGEQKAGKAGEFVAENADLRVRGETCPFVSRGGYKLQKALDTFPISLDGVVAADIGASTGGFTDCMLQHGAVRVYAIDVGYGQLDWKLRSDPRVRSGTDERALYGARLVRNAAGVRVDRCFLHFAGQNPPALWNCLADGGTVVALIKPQFEAGRDKVGKHGVVSDEKTHADVIGRIVRVADDAGFCVNGLSYSPIRGRKGISSF
jgi:23S rRNA (cytidine1920-2'-O)/16S rRNA (cytidine1409-2'-O)-methyltransferase